jgi:Ca-activated chloride channel family protein
VSFAAPLFLLGLLALPLALLVYVRFERRSRRSRAAFAPPALLPSVAPRRPGWRRHAAVAGYSVALGALVVALARPQASVAVPIEQATVVVVTDRSGSMLAQDVRPSRLVAARRAASTFLDEVPRDVRVGAIAFNHATQVLQSPTRDHEAVREALAGVQAAGSTATGDALAAALALVDRSREAAGRRTPAAIVLLSDGKSVRGRDPLEQADAARRAGVPVYTVALGTATGTIPSRDGAVPVPPDPDTLARVAERSGGQTFSVADAGRLERVYERLGSQVATERRKQDVGGLVAGGALLTLVGAAGSSLRWFGRFL